MTGVFKRCGRWQYLLAVLFAFMCIGSAIKTVGKAREGRTAFVRWMGDTQKLAQHEMIYGTDPEGYPNLPMAALFLTPFHSLGQTGGSIAWLILKWMAIAGILWTVSVMLKGYGKPVPAWIMVVLFLFSMRVFIGDLTHGNINLVIAGLIIAALACIYHKRDYSAGFIIGFAVVLKVTPLLFVAYFLWKRRWKSIAGAAVAAVLFTWLLPGLILGFDYNNELMFQWYKQMVQPFVSGAPVGYMQSRYDNQSFTGLLYRLCCDVTAIPMDVRRGLDEVRINIVDINQKYVSILLKVSYLSLLGIIAYFARTPTQDRKNLGNLGEYAMVFLAMLFISERSWKHHYVLLILAHSFILGYLVIEKPSGRRKWVPMSLLVAALLCHFGFGAATLGHHMSNIAEAYGIYVLGALLLFASCACVLFELKRAGWSSESNVG